MVDLAQFTSEPAKAKSPPDVNQLGAFGHSYATGVGAAAGAGCISVLGRMLKAASVANSAIAGAILAFPNGGAGAGGAGTIMQGWVPGRAAAPYVNPFAAGGAGVPVVVLMYGINDVGGHNKPEAFRHALRASIARVREARYFEENHAAFVYGGSWAAGLAYALMNSGAQVKQSTGLATATQTFTVPADFEGGVISSHWVAFAAAQVDFTVDGAPAGSLVIDASTMTSGGQNNAFVKRLTGLSAGAHTIVASTPVNAGGIFADGAGFEASSPPLILVPTIYRLPSYAGLGYAITPTDAAIDTYNQVIRDVCAEFDSRVAAVADGEQLLLSAANLFSDNLHPSERGHRAIAGVLHRVIKQKLTAEDLAYTA